MNSAHLHACQGISWKFSVTSVMSGETNAKKRWTFNLSN